MVRKVTDQETRQILALRKAGKSISGIHAETRISRPVIGWVLKRHGLNKRKPSSLSDANINELYRLLDQGLPRTKIAARLGISPSTVDNYIGNWRRRGEVQALAKAAGPAWGYAPLYKGVKP